VEETDNRSGIIIGATVDVVDTKGFTNLPGDSLYGGPTTGASKGNFGGTAAANFRRYGAKGANGDLRAPFFAIFAAATSSLEGNFSKRTPPPRESESFQRYEQT
jgi:hypothetical protein